MKVLVTGGYGFIGFHVAERFNKEGYEVHILDNLSSGNKNDIHFKHKSHCLSVEDTKCEKIFQSNQFDVVVHLAAQVNVTKSIENPRLDSESNVLGLVNMLTLSQKYKVKKFIFASSAAVYGLNEKLPLNEEDRCNPISPYGISKWVGESYCNKWKEMYGFDTLCFRFSNVYGPRQGTIGEGGVVSIFMERLLDGQTLTIFGDGEQTRDFIYVEDVADAIYRSSYSTLTGVYNLSTNSECSVNSLVAELKELRDGAAVVYKDSLQGDIRRSTLDNAAIMRDLDWVPMYTLKEGLLRTYTWFNQHSAMKEVAASAVSADKPSLLRQRFKPWMPYVENLLMFILTVWLTFSQWNETDSFIDIKLFYILIMGIIYGNRQAILAVILSIGLFVYEKLVNGRELISLLYDTDFFFQTAVYLFIGLVVGYAIERKTRLLQSQKRMIQELEDKHSFLNEVYTDVRNVKEELQQRILNSGDSFGKIYSITKELESLEPEEILTATVSVVEQIMGTREVSIYMANANRSYLRLVAHSNGAENEINKSVRVADHEYIQTILVEGKIFMNKQMQADAPFMAAPVQIKGETVAMIAIDSMKFENFSLYYQNLFKITIELVSSALSRAFSYTEATESKRYLDGTPILKQEVFAMILNSKRHAREKHNIHYLLLSASTDGVNIKEYAEKLTSILRETDYIGLGGDGQLQVLLSNTGLDDAAHVLKRFADKHVSLQLLEEEGAYG